MVSGFLLKKKIVEITLLVNVLLFFALIGCQSTSEDTTEGSEPTTEESEPASLLEDSRLLKQNESLFFTEAGDFNEAFFSAFIADWESCKFQGIQNTNAITEAIFEEAPFHQTLIDNELELEVYQEFANLPTKNPEASIFVYEVNNEMLATFDTERFKEQIQREISDLQSKNLITDEGANNLSNAIDTCAACGEAICTGTMGSLQEVVDENFISCKDRDNNGICDDLE